ncbi:hypothetical protein F4775DRAFT_599136 [Biscogniauxia sp. FL1348]|nr:hypothetical protein F4775DRAFT_599136 [Biscogniauxia sp. FL1348]
MSVIPFRPQEGFHAPEALLSLTLALPPNDSPRYVEQHFSKNGFVALYLQNDKPSAELLAQWYMFLLDKHFFFGSLCRIVSLKVLQGDVTKPDLHGYYSPGEREIVLFLCPGGRLQQHDEVLDTLIHEMAHAYVDIFSNKWLAMSPEQLQAHEGHGVYWHCLFHSIVNRVRRWHPSLENFVTQVHLVPSQRFEIRVKAYFTDLLKRLTGLDL